MRRIAALTLSGALCLSGTPLGAVPVTQQYLDSSCRKIYIQVIDSDASSTTRPARVIIAYACQSASQKIEYEALHFFCPPQGPRTIAAAIYDVVEQTYLADAEGVGDYRTVIKPEDVPTPSCDLRL